MNKDDVLKLATLARIEVSDAEATELAGDMENILAYVGQVNDLDLTEEDGETGPIFNVMREDNNAHESGLYTEDLLQAAPEREGDYIKVKKIL